VRGHSNVQGDRTMGINERAPEAFMAALERELGMALSRRPGHNVQGAMAAMLAGQARVFMGLGGNFARATPDSALIAAAMDRLEMTVHVGTKLNHGHLLPGRVGYLLPCLGRTEIDRNAGGERQIITVEDSMSMVHGSGGINLPASEHLRSEVAIVAGIAAATVGEDRVGWTALAQDYDQIREMIARVLPAFAGFNEKVRVPRGFWLRNPASEREWRTASGKAQFAAPALPERTEWQKARPDHGQFVLQTFRSHDQYNTTIYGMDDRYRGVYGARDVVFMNPADIAAIGAEGGARVDLTGLHDDGLLRRIAAFRLVPYDIPAGCIAGYYPELNTLVPHSAYGEGSFTPASKSILVQVDVVQ
ncbi:MAG TPA: molybdopterin dinucleotide binding domain-containing protein, partial [Paenirhodobacter sp.]